MREEAWNEVVCVWREEAVVRNKRAPCLVRKFMMMEARCVLIDWKIKINGIRVKIPTNNAKN